METYVIAVRRDARDRAPADWLRTLGDIPGLAIRGAANPLRVQVEASPEAIEQVQRSLGSFCHIEALIPHHKL